MKKLFKLSIAVMMLLLEPHQFMLVVASILAQSTFWQMTFLHYVLILTQQKHVQEIVQILK